ncbi:MAG: cytidylate kinase-like family protein [Bacteroidales bacterium]|nr:cytidylate kinase-like family protein [Bacteroidales bacterium]
MRIDLKKYLTEQYEKSIHKDVKPGPVLTISREYGCSAKELAKEIIYQLQHEKPNEKDWTWINKEIFENTAKALNLKERRILHVFEGKKLGLVDSLILSSAEKYYKSDKAIQKKMIEVVRSFAEKGRTIIIGLGSAIICRDIEKSLHIRLEAPFDWRVKKVAERNNQNIKEVEKIANDIDQKRAALRKSFLTKNACEKVFDVTFNVKNLNNNEIAEIVIFMMKKRKMI